LDANLNGLIIAIASISYVAGPYLGRLISKKFGLKKVILLSWFTTTSMLFLTIMISNPIALIIFRTIEGISNGAFWPNIWNYITYWEKFYDQEDQQIEFLKIFNYSWNLGLILGYGTGNIIVFFTTDYIGMIISVSIAAFSFLFVFLLEPSEKFFIRNKRAVVVHGLKLTPENWEEYKNPEKAPYTKSSKPSLIYVPLVMCMGGIIYFASTKSVYRFTLPYFLELANQASFWVYGIVLFQQLLQMAGLQLIRKYEKKRYGYWIAILFLLSSSITLIIFTISNASDYIVIIAILNIVSGLFFGIMQGVSQRIVLDKGKARNTTKYTMLSEVFVGVSFGIPPIIAGFLFEIDFIYVFAFLIALSTILMGILLRFHIDYVKKEKLGIFNE
jgi:MFS family permease